MTKLPVTVVLPELIAALADDHAVVLRAPPGAGKTTAVPPAILRSGIVSGKTLVIQPRRLAARTAASRLAQIMGSTLGDSVGYQVRFDNRTSKNTKLITMTTGILLRRLQTDPLLEDIDCVILDEFHERSVDLDLALGMLTRIRRTLRPELKLVVMSATLDPAPIVDFLGTAVAIESKGRSYPVEVTYEDSISRERLETQVLQTTQRAFTQTEGDVLVFLPGVGEIRRCETALRDLQSDPSTQHSFVVHLLYGDLPADKQDAVLSPSQQRKVILATNVAETSITIDGVTAVIDSGLSRVMLFDQNLGLPKLQLQPISKASAEQRSGRAGRTSPGIAYRLWPKAAHRMRPDRDSAEIQRCDFSGPMLLLTAWGERDTSEFPWLTPPPDHAVVAAKTLLKNLGAIDDEELITELGQQMLDLPLSPRLARFMIAACRRGSSEDASIAAALLTERDPFRGSSLSFQDRVQTLKDFDSRRTHVEQSAAAKNVLRVSKQIRIQSKHHLEAASDPDLNGLEKTLLVAFPDRLAKHRDHDPTTGVMVGGRGVKFDRGFATGEHDLAICLDVDSAGTEAKVRMAIAIDQDWLPSESIAVIDEPMYDASLQAVVARRRRKFHDLMLAESPIKCEPSKRVASILAEAARPEIDRILAGSSKELVRWIDRVRFVTDAMPELELPPIDEVAIDEVLLSLCQTRTKISQLHSAPWLDHLRGRFSYQQSQQIDQHAPARFALPSGNSVAVVYDGGKPRMEVRIQELFGLASTPRIAGGRVPITLHLLGPNYRPQQITDDLENFWAETYAHVRKELRGRYPKHHWPENPSHCESNT